MSDSHHEDAKDMTAGAPDYERYLAEYHGMMAPLTREAWAARIAAPARAAAAVRAGALSAERRATHGDWRETALIAHELRGVVERAQLRRRLAGRPPLPPHQIEALGQIGFKAARILAGDPDWPDHWDDIAGYAQLGKLAPGGEAA